jgi:hypothetical protein
VSKIHEIENKKIYTKSEQNKICFFERQIKSLAILTQKRREENHKVIKYSLKKWT